MYGVTYRNLGWWGVVEFSFWNSRRGVAGGSDAIFYHLVGGRDAIFLRIAGYIFSCIALLFCVRFTPKFYSFDIVTTWTEG